MNELELAQFAAPAAQALLTAMVSDGWGALKSRFARIMAGRSGDPEASERDLDELRQRILAERADGDAERGTNEAFALICVALARDPGIAEPLKSLMGEVTNNQSQVRTDSVTQSAVARDHGAVFQQISGTQNYNAK